MATTQPNPRLFWGSFTVMMIVVVGGGIAVSLATQQYAVVFFVQLLIAVTWTVVFSGYRRNRDAPTRGDGSGA